MRNFNFHAYIPGVSRESSINGQTSNFDLNAVIKLFSFSLDLSFVESELLFSLIPYTLQARAHKLLVCLPQLQLQAISRMGMRKSISRKERLSKLKVPSERKYICKWKSYECAERGQSRSVVSPQARSIEHTKDIRECVGKQWKYLCIALDHNGKMWIYARAFVRNASKKYKWNRNC